MNEVDKYMKSWTNRGWTFRGNVSVEGGYTPEEIVAPYNTDTEKAMSGLAHNKKTGKLMPEHLSIWTMLRENVVKGPEDPNLDDCIKDIENIDKRLAKCASDWKKIDRKYGKE